MYSRKIISNYQVIFKTLKNRFFFPFFQYLLSAYHMPGTDPGPGDTG